jgi:hypothetical protein
MTEEEWLACTDPEKMLEALRAGGLLPERKARLFGAACCRRIWHLLDEGPARTAVEVAELYADGRAEDGELAGAVSGLDAAPGGTYLPEVSLGQAVRSALFLDAESAAYYAAFSASCRDGSGKFVSFLGAVDDELGVQSGLLRDLWGNPFRLITLLPTWLTPQVVALARAAYEERELPGGTLDLARLAILADALEEAGGDQADILDHLRGPGPHVRGCWAVDLLLGKG